MSQDSQEGDSFIRNSALYQEFLAEREEILKHKWIESEKVGHDVGFEKALLDWIVKHRAAWRAERQRRTRRTNGIETSSVSGIISHSNC
jgi:hypothetical protein